MKKVLAYWPWLVAAAVILTIVGLAVFGQERAAAIICCVFLFAIFLIVIHFASIFMIEILRPDITEDELKRILMGLNHNPHTRDGRPMPGLWSDSFAQWP